MKSDQKDKLMVLILTCIYMVPISTLFFTQNIISKILVAIFLFISINFFIYSVWVLEKEVTVLKQKLEEK
jgi:hypothetical protein